MTIFLATSLICGDEDCDKRKCIKKIEDVFDAVYILIDPGHGGTELGAPIADLKKLR